MPASALTDIKQTREEAALPTILSATQDKLTSSYIKYLVFSPPPPFENHLACLSCKQNMRCLVCGMFVFVTPSFIKAPGTKRTDCSHICVSGPCIIQRLVLGDIIIRT